MTEDSSEGEDRGPLVKLTSCGDNQEASSIRSLLEANGIFSFVQGEQHRSMLGDFGPYIELNILVGERDLAEAQAILDDRAPIGEPGRSELASEGVDGEPPEIEAQEAGDPRDDRARRRRLKVWIILWVFFLGPGIFFLILELSRG